MQRRQAAKHLGLEVIPDSGVRRDRSPLWISIVAGLVFAGAAQAQQGGFEREPISYLTAPVTDSVAELADELASGATTLSYDPQYGYLPAVLDALDIPVSSQTLVFSKTSLQLQKISPRRPRALYFNDDVYVGYCQQGDVLELAATDPKQGAIFYTLDQTEVDHPRMVRDRGQCLTCHASSRTQDVPGYLVRSVYVNAAGHPILGSGTFTSDHTSPFEERWGGWYVTGQHGQMRHLGNQLFKNEAETQGLTDEALDAGANCESLEPYFRTSNYMTPHSDLVALMVLEHQTQVHNAICAANFETRQALHQSYEMNEVLDREEGFVSPSANRRIDAVADNLVRYLLLAGEYPLESPVSGTSQFAAEFEAKGVRDSAGRSLKDLDLQMRLFRYPCSYLIYSEAFEGLPEIVRHRVIDRIWAILKSSEPQPDYPFLTPENRTAISQILVETKPEFARRE